MSCYEWSSGKIVLPSNQFAAVRKAVQEAQTEKVETLFNETQMFWKSLSVSVRKDPEAYWKAATKWAYSGRFPEGQVLDFLDLVREPKRVQKGDMVRPTNRTLHYYDGEFSLTFDPATRSVQYDVHENNHAREWAEKTRIHQAFMAALDKVHWSSTSGGVILGNDEYHREGGYSEEGGGGSYVVMAIGPRGAKEAPSRVTTPFLNSKGEKCDVEVKEVRGRFVGKVVPYRAPAQRVGVGRWY